VPGLSSKSLSAAEQPRPTRIPTASQMMYFI
jgi:hypothetical protein